MRTKNVMKGDGYTRAHAQLLSSYSYCCGKEVAHTIVLLIRGILITLPPATRPYYSFLFGLDWLTLSAGSVWRGQRIQSYTGCTSEARAVKK